MSHSNRITRSPGASESTGASDASDAVILPLAPLVKGLPDSLKAFIAQPPDARATVSFPVSRIMPQLAKGAIKVTFDELCQAAAGVFAPSHGSGETEIPLPLKEVLPQLSSALQRKSARQAPSVEPKAFFSPASAPAPSSGTAPTSNATVAVAPATASSAPARSVPAAPPGQAAFPMRRLLEGMPDECRQLADMPAAADLIVNLPVDRLAPQLPTGKVTVTMQEIADALPPGTFAGLGEQATTPVKIPLADVLAQIGPGSLQRKQPLKKLEGLPEQDFFGAGRAQAATTPPPVAAPAAVFSPTPPSPSATFQPASAPSSPAAGPSTAIPPAASATAPPPPTAPPGQAAFHLPAILARLPEDLRTLVARQPGEEQMIYLDAGRLAPQLAKGRVSITLKELAEASPVGTFVNVAGKESQPVALPLGEVLTQIGPGAIQRRQPTKTLTGLEKQDFFGTSNPGAPPETEATTFIPKPGPPESGTGYTTFQPAPKPTPAPAVPPAPTGVASASTVFIPAESAPPPTVARIEATVPPSDTVAIPVTRLIERWSAQLKSDIARLPENTVIIFPAEALGQALKTGRVHFTWAQLRDWSRPRTALSTPALEAAGHLDIPLRAVVGPFMAAMRGKPAPADCSTPSPPSAQATTAAPTAPGWSPGAPTLGGISMTGSGEPRPAPEVFVTPAPISSQAAAETATLGDLLGQPEKSAWTPIEIVKRVAGLPGVGGAMLSLAEGQVAAAELSEIPSPAAVAREIPKVHQATADAVRGMGLDPLAHVSFTAAGTPWVIFRLGNIFFTVQGRPGEHPPVARLESIAGQVATHCR